MNIIPLGAAGTVTGSRTLVTSGNAAILVDCGLFQGLKNLRLRNWRPFPFPPKRLGAVVLTHAHLDHSGTLPILVREGFRGPIYVTPPTLDLLPILLLDAGRIQEEDARYAKKKGFSRHAEPRALFTEADAQAVLPLLEPVPFHREQDAGGFRVTFHRAGHILGAAQVRVEDQRGDSVLFSGDLGQDSDLLLPAPEPRPEAGRVVMESTYGDRDHDREDPLEILARAARETLGRGGVLMVPSFAVGRAQTLALAFHRLQKEGRIPTVPMFLNSPMAIEVGGVHLGHLDELRPADGELDQALEALQPVGSIEESKALNRRRGPMIIVAGAGMLSGGRILHHLLAFGDDPANTLLLVGFQAEGTRGRDLLQGRRDLRIHGRNVELKCQIEVRDLFSGHADRNGLLAWLRNGPEPKEGVSLVHGEPSAADALRRLIKAELGWSVQVAEEGRPLELEETAPGPPAWVDIEETG
ncbi:MAG: MBL fold metallo-hydrolase [Gemmatimonadales bacterium]|nr:MAG: MBL fold metallo-hydrolase [Gemmatimonadales bacterium]